LLLKISTVLEFDFFEQFSKNAENSKKQLELMREEIQMLKDYNALLKSNGTKD
jgi:hypothetical protein